MLDLYDYCILRDPEMSTSNVVCVLKMQRLVAVLRAADDMPKSSNVTLVSKTKIGTAQAAIAIGKQTVELLRGKLFLADAIPRRHPELAALLTQSL